MGAGTHSLFSTTGFKGEVAVALRAQDWPSLTRVCGGARSEPRPAGHVCGYVLGILSAVLPRRFRIGPATRIADALATHAIADAPVRRLVDDA